MRDFLLLQGAGVISTFSLTFILLRSAILDAHYTSLAMAPDCRALLEELSGIVKGETVLMREMLSLDGLLSHVVLRKRLPMKPYREYFVETMYL